MVHFKTPDCLAPPEDFPSSPYGLLSIWNPCRSLQESDRAEQRQRGREEQTALTRAELGLATGRAPSTLFAIRRAAILGTLASG